MANGIDVTFSRPGSANSSPGIADLAYGVMEEFDRDTVVQTQNLTAHPGVRRFLLPATAGSGGPLRTDIRLRETTSAAWVSPFEITSNNRRDLMGRLTAEYKHNAEHFLLDEKEEAYTSGDRTRIYDHLQQQHNGVMTKLWDLNEAGVWNAPSSSSDLKSQFGITWLMPGLDANEESEGSFNGIYARYASGTKGNGTVGGVDLTNTDNERVKRFAATYDGDVHEGLFQILRNARLRTSFTFVPGLKQAASVETGTPAYTAGGSILFAPTAQYLAFLDYANKKIQNGGDGEIDRMFGEIVVDGMVVVHTPYLDNFVDASMFAINTRHLYAKILTDRRFKWLPAERIGTEVYKMECVTSFAVHNANPRSAGFRIHKKYTS